MAKVDMTQLIVDLDGKAVKSPEGKELSLRALCENSLLGMSPESKLSGEEKAKRYALAMKVHGNDVVDLSAEEITKIKKVVGDSYSPLAVGRAYELLDPKE